MNTSTPFWEKDDFKQLQREWYSRLADEGFKDIEKGIDDSSLLHKWSSYAYREVKDPHVRMSRSLYFQALTEGAATQPFDTDVDAIVISKRAEGERIKDIAEYLKQQSLKPCHRESIRCIIRKYEHRWGIRTWKPEQLDRNYRTKKHV